MITKIIGTGAGGNKAAICAVKNNIINPHDVLLVNSTLKDIPHDYKCKENCVEFSNSYGGCGKERKMAYKLCSQSIQDGTLDLDTFLGVDTDRQAELVIIATSTEGGTGSGSTPLMAKYIRDVLGISVMVFAFTGFEEDVRGIKNTVEFFQEMEDNFIVQCIRLSKFMSRCNGNKIKCEIEADKEFCNKISVVMGLQLRDSDHNIDPTDLLKISTTEGYMIVETCIFAEKIKNREQFRKAVIDMCDESTALDLDDPSQRKLAVVINLRSDCTDYIDYHDILIERYGVCFEKFEHIQDEKDMPQFISFISAGLKMPVQEVEDIYNRYVNMGSKVNKDKDDFFAAMKKKNFLEKDEMFDMGSQTKNKSTINKRDFFSNVEKKEVAKNVEDMY